MAEVHTQRWEKIAVFAFGVTFVSILLVLVLFFPTLTPEAYTIFRIVIALAAAGIGAVIPGVLDVRMKGLLRAGGAMALFVIVYFFSPPAATPVTEPPILANPSENPDRAITEWLALIDGGSYAKAWAGSSNLTKNSYDEATLVRIFESQRTPLGTVVARKPYGLQALTALPNGRKGNFRLYTYQTAFASGQEYMEGLLVVAEDGKWKVLEHNLGPLPK